MTVSFPVAVKRLKGQNIVKNAAKHNLREIAAEIGAANHINAARIGENIILRGAPTADEVARTARLLMVAGNVRKLRVDAVQGLEVLFTLPLHSNVDIQEYFEQATAWVESYYGAPVLSSVVHFDESCPHCHVLILPLVNGRMIGSDLHGHASKLQAMQADFFEKVSSRFGFSRQMRKKRLSQSQRQAAIHLARERLHANSGLQEVVIDELLKPHQKDPAPLLHVLGLAMPADEKRRAKTFVEIMTRPEKKGVVASRYPGWCRAVVQ